VAKAYINQRNYNHPTRSTVLCKGYRNPNARRPAPIYPASVPVNLQLPGLPVSMPLTPPKLLYQTHQATTQRRSTLQSLVLVILAHLTFIPITIVFWWPRSVVLSVCMSMFIPMSYIFMTSVMVIVVMSRVRLSRVVVWRGLGMRRLIRVRGLVTSTGVIAILR
jgi:hypothetical protein